MLLPAMKAVSVSTSGVTAFKGLNHNLKINEYEFYDMKNMSSALLPVIASRGKRGRVRSFTKCNGLFAHEKLCWVDGTDFIYDGITAGQVTDGQKQFVRMGAYVLIWPDKKYYNVRTKEFGALEAYYTSAGTVSATISKADGTIYTGYTTAATAPQNPANGDYWLDTSTSPVVLRQYSDTNSMWESVATVYVKISAAGIGAQFAEYDGVTIAGMDNDALNGDFFLLSRDTNWIVVTAILSAPITANTKTVTVSRTAPDMEYLTECDNRVWGCNSEKNEIYACAQGDPKNWRQYMTLSTDSYAVTVGSAGPFTGAITHLGAVLFFKGDVIHQIMGTMPSNYTIDTTGVRGVAEGSAASLCVVNEVLYYLAGNDVCAYGQSLPTTISAPLGTGRYRDGVGGQCGRYYYLCATDEAGARELLAYDTDSQVWMKEDETDVRWFAALGQELYFVTGNTLRSMRGTLDDYGDDGKALEGPVEWMLETGELGLDAPYNKYITGMQLYAETEIGATLRVEIRYDAAGSWEEIFRDTPMWQRSMVIPIATKRCRTLKLRLSGKGAFKLWSMVRKITAGSDHYAT